MFTAEVPIVGRNICWAAIFAAIEVTTLSVLGPALTAFTLHVPNTVAAAVATLRFTTAAGEAGEALAIAILRELFQG